MVPVVASCGLRDISLQPMQLLDSVWRFIVGISNATACPLAVVVIALVYRKSLAALIPNSRLKLSISGVEVEITPRELQQSVNVSLRGRHLSREQWDWLRRLRDSGRTENPKDEYKVLSPLRNGGLILEHPEGWLSKAEEIEITPLGRILLDAHDSVGARRA